MASVIPKARSQSRRLSAGLGCVASGAATLRSAMHLWEEQGMPLYSDELGRTQ